jgi:hypothetical protein
METLIKTVVSSLLVNQGVAVGTKLINNRPVTDREKTGLGLALLVFALVSVATSQTETNALTKR